MKDYLKSKKHSTMKCSKQKLRETQSSCLSSTSRQVTLPSIVQVKRLERRVCIRLLKALHSCRYSFAYDREDAAISVEVM